MGVQRHCIICQKLSKVSTNTQNPLIIAYNCYRLFIVIEGTSQCFLSAQRDIFAYSYSYVSEDS